LNQVQIAYCLRTITSAAFGENQAVKSLQRHGVN
jgi:hypothetical protein